MRGIMIAAAAGGAFALVPGAGQAQPSGTVAHRASAVDPAQIRAVVIALAGSLEENYVFPDIGKRYAAALRSKLEAGGYAALADDSALAAALTADLQAVSPDGHLRVFGSSKKPKMRGGGSVAGGAEPETMIEKSGWIAPGVAYISFLAMMADEPTMKAVRQFVDEHGDAKVLIIDARHHRGGGVDEMDILFSRIFARPTDLLVLDERAAVDAREGSEFGDLPSLRKVAGPAGVVRRVHSAIPSAEPTALSDARVFVLTSNKTASAGEHLAEALKRTKRGTVVGETTMGMGNFAHSFPLPEGYSAFIPVGRTFDPDTGEGWEGKGVAPDVTVPADQALDKALELAGVEPAKAPDALANLH